MNEGHINHNATEDEQGNIEVFYLGVVYDRRQNQEHCSNEDQDGEDYGNLYIHKGQSNVTGAALVRQLNM